MNSPNGFRNQSIGLGQTMALMCLAFLAGCGDRDSNVEKKIDPPARANEHVSVMAGFEKHADNLFFQNLNDAGGAKTRFEKLAASRTNWAGGTVWRQAILTTTETSTTSPPIRD